MSQLSIVCNYATLLLGSHRLPYSNDVVWRLRQAGVFFGHQGNSPPCSSVPFQQRCLAGSFLSDTGK